MSFRTPARSALLRGLVVLLLVSYLVWNTDWARFRQVLLEANWGLLALSLAAFGPTPLLIAFRLKWLLEVHRIQLTAWQAIKVTFAGQFITWALPLGTSGGDALKTFYIARDTPHKHEAVITVLFDRFIGVASLLLMSGCVVLVQWGNPAFAVWGRRIGGLLVLLLLGGGVYFSGRCRRLLRLEKLIARLPLGVHFRRLDAAVLAFRHCHKRLLACLAITFLLQTVAIVSMFLAGWALGLVGEPPVASFPVYLGYTPICFLAGALPLGAMEATFQQLFSQAAGLGTPEAAMALSLLGVRLVQLVWALPGAVVVLRSRPQPVEDPLLDSGAVASSGGMRP